MHASIDEQAIRAFESATKCGFSDSLCSSIALSRSFDDAKASVPPEGDLRQPRYNDILVEMSQEMCLNGDWEASWKKVQSLAADRIDYREWQRGIIEKSLTNSAFHSLPL